MCPHCPNVSLERMEAKRKGGEAAQGSNTRRTTKGLLLWWFRHVDDMEAGGVKFVAGETLLVMNASRHEPVGSLCKTGSAAKVGVSFLSTHGQTHFHQVLPCFSPSCTFVVVLA